MLGENWTEGQKKWSKYVCRACQARRDAVYKSANSAAISERASEYSQRNAERIRAQQNVYRANNKQRKAEWNAANREKKAVWRKANPGKRAAYQAKRRANLCQLTPDNADMALIRAIYERAAHLTRTLNVSYHVDHIRPLALGGLHHQDNLIIMRGDLNLAKGANEWPWLNWFNRA